MILNTHPRQLRQASSGAGTVFHFLTANMACTREVYFEEGSLNPYQKLGTCDWTRLVSFLLSLNIAHCMCCFTFFCYAHNCQLGL